MTTYQSFLDSKRVVAQPSGFAVSTDDLNPSLFPFQKMIVQWAIQRGRAAVFADTGLGKTLTQLECAKHIAAHTGQPVLILAPLAVAAQTVREGAKFGIVATHCRRQADVQPGVNIANYEMLQHFEPAVFGGLILDESSILKGFDGTVRKQITAFGKMIPYRFAFTATPAPNDLIELTNHAEFLSIMEGKEIIALWFTQDGNTTHQWRLKGHARDDFWRWLASWAVAIRRPSDLGYDDEAFELPPLRTHQITVGVSQPQSTLFPVEALTLGERLTARRESIEDRVAAAAKLANETDEPCIVWCHLNKESEQLAKAIPDAIEILGSHSPDSKEQAIIDFVDQRKRVLVTKPSVAGFGMNFQHCNRVIFVGLSDSFEQFYQAIRRCWRFGQQRPVDVYLVSAETEGAVVKNLERKECQAHDMMEQIVRHMRGLQAGQSRREEMAYEPTLPMTIPFWLKDVTHAA